LDTKQHKQHIVSIALLFVVATIWGSGFIGTQMALDAKLDSSFIMFVRFTIATFIIGTVFFKDIKKNLRPQHLKGGLIIGLFLFLAFFIQTVGLKYTTPANNAFITASNVVMVPFLWWVVSKKKPKNKIFISSALCLIGIGVLSLNFVNGFSFSVGDLLTLGCAFLFACQIVATGILAASMDARVLVFLQFAVSAVLSFLVFMFTNRDFTAFASPKGMMAVIYLGVFSTCICYFLQTVAQKNVESSKTAMILSTEALFGTFFSVLLGYDKLSANMVAGGLIIIVSILMAEVDFTKSDKAKKIIKEGQG